MRLIAVVMGTPSSNASAQASKRLLDYGFRFFNTDELFGQNQAIQNVRVYMGNRKMLPVGTIKPTYVTYPRSEVNQIVASLGLNTPIKAPIQKGQELGQLIVQVSNKTILSSPVFALEAINEGGLFSRVSDMISMTFSHHHATTA